MVAAGSQVWEPSIGMSAPCCITSSLKEQPPKDALMFGYPISSKKTKWDNDKR